ncbi:MAG: PEGA domain-containing protein [Candidatus Pacebacteria bacterium]|nr:PEGA domain-containing protein [Candidatus Paceibacterota bacterium]
MSKKIISLLLALIIIIVAAVVYFINPFGKKLKSGLQVITDGGSASLFLNDQYLDKSPYINKKIIPGDYTLKIEPDNPELVAYETPISLIQGLLTVVTWKPGSSIETSGGTIYEMAPLGKSNSNEVSFITIPDNALISIDGQEAQFAPLVVPNLKPGHHQFEVKLPSYLPQTHTFNVIDGYSLNISVKLIRSESALEEAKQIEQTDDQTATDSSKLEEQVKIQPTGFYQDGKEVLRVRDQAGLTGKTVGFVEVGQNYPYQGETLQGWYKINFTQGEATQTGWVSGDYSQLIK